MANNRIKGITIELDGDTKGLDKALQGVNQESGKLQGELKQVERALKFDPSNVELLRQKQELLTQSITQTSEKLDVLRTAQSQVQAQFDRGEIGADQYRAFQRELIATEGQLQSLQRRLNETGESADETGRDFNELGESLKKTGDQMKETGSTMTKGLTAPIVAAGAAAGLSAKQFDDATAKIQTSLGLTVEEAKNLEGVAKNVWKNGFGESLEEVTDALVRVKQNIKGITDEAELERVTESALALAKTFDSDVNEVTRAGNNLMTNFGISSEKAFDMMAKGAQNGLNFSNEMFDNLAEYAPLWSDMGFSAEEMFGILESGAKHGVYNMDYLNDVMKEFGIRIGDGSKSTSDAMAGMLQSTQDLFHEFQGGTVTSAEMAKAIAADLATLENVVDRNALGVSLFGTKWEDLGGDVVLAMLNAGQGLENFEGAMQGIVEVQEQTFGQRWDSMTRNAATALEPLGMILLDLAEQWLPKIIAVLQILASWFANLSPVIQILVVAFGAILAAIGPLLVVIGTVISTLGTLIPLFTSGGVGATAFGAVMAALTGPIGITIAAITGIIAVLVLAYNKVEWFRDGVNSVWDNIKSATAIAFEAIKKTISTVIDAVVKFVKSQLDVFKKFWEENGKFISSIVKFYFEQISFTIKMVMGIIKGIFEVVWPLISSTVRTTWETIKLIVSTGINLVLGIIQTVLKLLQGDWKGAWDTILKTIKNIWTDIGKFLKGIDLKQTGKDIIKGLITGIGSMATAVWDKVKSITDGIKDSITGALKIKSPSRVTMDYGVNINEGLIKGIDQSSGRLQKSMDNVYGSLASSASKSNANQIASQQIINQSSNIDLTSLVGAIISLANRPVETSVFMNDRVIAAAVSAHQYNDASIAALLKGTSL